MSEKDDYLRFNVGSVDQLIKQKLEPKFPDVSFRGSSANILSETVASVFSLIMYQLNRTAANSSFSKTQSLTSLIEQTKLLGYNPIGHQAGSMFVNILPNDTFSNISYTIPRFSYINTVLGNFTTTSDIEFTYSGSPDIALVEDVVLKGGRWVESPIIIGDGTTNQRITVSDTNVLIGHGNISVFIRDVNGADTTWKEWEQVGSLFLSSGFDRHFESRLNTTGGYDLTFGDGVNGCYIPDGAEVAVYYLSVSTPSAVLEVGEINENLVRFRTDQLDGILLDIIDTDVTSVFANTTGRFLVQNTSINTFYSEPESLEDIRRNAPVAFQTQNRLVTSEDFRSFILNNYSDFISDVVVLSNDQYLNEYLKYYYEQGLNNPNLESRAFYNQINYADSCNFNNVYVFLIPKTGNYASNIQKKLIIDEVESIKTITSNVVPSDPIYVNFGLATPVNAIVSSDLNTSSLDIVKSSNTNRSDEDIQNEVYNTINTYFTEKGLTFSNQIDIFELNASILNIDGVQEVYTVNEGIRNQGLQFYQFNPQFPDKVFTTPPNNLFSGIFVPRLFDNNLYSQISITTT